MGVLHVRVRHTAHVRCEQRVEALLAQLLGIEGGEAEVLRQASIAHCPRLDIGTKCPQLPGEEAQVREPRKRRTTPVRDATQRA